MIERHIGKFWFYLFTNWKLFTSNQVTEMRDYSGVPDTGYVIAY